jgi:hypothetical protein
MCQGPRIVLGTQWVTLTLAGDWQSPFPIFQKLRPIPSERPRARALCDSDSGPFKVPARAAGLRRESGIPPRGGPGPPGAESRQVGNRPGDGGRSLAA